MRWFVPCKLGEEYPETKFLDWAKGTRVFGETGKILKLTGIDVGMKAGWADCPEEFRDYTAVSERGALTLENYQVGKWNFEKLLLEIQDAEFEERLIGRKKAKLIGFRYREDGILGHYVTGDRYEHFYEPVNIEFAYTEYTGSEYIHFDFQGGKENDRY